MTLFLRKLLILLTFSLFIASAQASEQIASCDGLEVCLDKCTGDDESCLDMCYEKYTCQEDQEVIENEETTEEETPEES